MVMMRPIPAAMAIAAVGMVLFFVYHWFFVAPVWAILVEGWIWVAINGAAIGWAYQRVFLDRGRTGVRWGTGYGALMAATLVPFLVMGLLHGPYPEVASFQDALPLLPLAVLGVPASMLIAWGLAGWRNVAWPFVVACLPAGVMIGGSIAAFGGTVDLFLLFIAIQVMGGTLLALLVTWRPTRKEPGVPV